MQVSGDALRGALARRLPWQVSGHALRAPSPCRFQLHSVAAVVQNCDEMPCFVTSTIRHQPFGKFLPPRLWPGHRFPRPYPDRPPRHCCLGRHRHPGSHRRHAKYPESRCGGRGMPAPRSHWRHSGWWAPGRLSASSQSPDSGPETGHARACGRPVVPAPPNRAAVPARRCGAASPGHGRWACAYPAPTNAPWWCHRCN